MTKFTFAASAFLVSNVGETARWYRDVLGFEFDTFPSEEPFEWASVRRDQVEIMLQRAEGYEKPDLDRVRPGGVWNAYFYVTEVDRLFDQIKDRATIRREPSDQPYRLREFEIADPNGYVLVFGQNIAEAAGA